MSKLPQRMASGIFLKIFKLSEFRHFGCTATTKARRWNKEETFQSELRNPVEAVYGTDKKSAEDVGEIFDKKPFKVSTKKYHLYVWCGCGRSHGQPFCDYTCKSMYLKKIIKCGPVKFIAPEDKDIWFCMCKQTKRRPFCDGSHRDPEIQELKIDGKFNLWEPTSSVQVEKVVEKVDDISDEELLFGDLDEATKKPK